MAFAFLSMRHRNLRTHSQHTPVHELDRNRPIEYNKRVNTKLCGKLDTLINARYLRSMVDPVLLKDLSFGLREFMGGLGSRKCTSPRNVVWIFIAIGAEPGSRTQLSGQRFKSA